MPERYAYKPLAAGRSIRVLKLRPALSVGADISCSLHDASLNKHDPAWIQYEALSYVWGAKSADVPIVCDGGTVFVTKNCEDALRRLRWKTMSRYLWIDSVCINQADIEERNAQVRLMGDVFRLAKRVLIWLGPENPPFAIRQTIRFLTSISGLTSLLSGRLQFKIVEMFGDKLRSLAEIWQKSEWANRVWTFPEYLLANERRFIQGNCEVSNLDRPRNYWARTQMFRSFKMYSSWDNRTEGLEWLQPRRLKGATARFLLRAACRMQTLDPRDRVFSIYELLKDQGVHVPNPDYTKTSEQVYHEATIACIVANSNFEYNFRLWPRAPGTSGLPSWVPDLGNEDTFGARSRSGRVLLRTDAWENADHVTAALPTCDVNVTLPNIASPEPDRRLNVQAISIGSVDKLGEMVPPVENADASALDEWATHTFEMAYHANKRFPTALPNFLDAFYTMMCFGLNLRDPSAPTIWYEWQMEFSYMLIRIYIRWILSKRFEIEADLDFEGAKISTDIDVSFRHDERARILGQPFGLFSHHNFLDHLWGLKFFTLDSGLFGLGHALVKPQDVVVLIRGFSLPIILRPEGAEWIFMGPAIVPGVMYGEKWPEWENDLETFVVI